MRPEGVRDLRLNVSNTLKQYNYWNSCDANKSQLPTSINMPTLPSPPVIALHLQGCPYVWPTGHLGCTKNKLNDRNDKINEEKMFNFYFWNNPYPSIHICLNLHHCWFSTNNFYLVQVKILRFSNYKEKRALYICLQILYFSNLYYGNKIFFYNCCYWVYYLVWNKKQFI